jgi:ribulose-phosphate 3-epimerase
MGEVVGRAPRGAGRPPLVAARILAADIACLGHEVTAAVRSGADLVHVDVMDQGSVPNPAVGPLVCSALRCVSRAPLEIHLMVKPVDNFVAAFAGAGADVIVFHPEASEDPARTVARVRELGCRAGIALNPSTPLSVVDGLLADLDQVLFMWASPGFDGGRFLPSALPRIRALRERIAAAAAHVAISVEGGVEADTAAELLRAGADTLVVGAALCRSGDRAGAIAALKGAPPPACVASAAGRALGRGESAP